MSQPIELTSDSRDQRGSTSTEAVIATPVFVAVVLMAMEIMVLSWKALTLQLVADQAARDWALWTGCTADSYGDCSDNTRETTLRTSIRQMGSHYGLKLVTEGSSTSQPRQNTQIGHAVVLSNVGKDLCNQPKRPTGTEDGRGDLVAISITHTNDLFGLGLYQLPITAEAMAIIEPYAPGRQPSR